MEKFDNVGISEFLFLLMCYKIRISRSGDWRDII